jgi:hypothetical protein
MEHYKEFEGIKLWSKIYILDHHTIKECEVWDIFDDERYSYKWFKTNIGKFKSEDVFKYETDAKQEVQRRKNAYDRYVTGGF